MNNKVVFILYLIICLVFSQTSPIPLDPIDSCDNVSCICSASGQCSSCQWGFIAYDQYQCSFQGNSSYGQWQTPIPYCVDQMSDRDCLMCVLQYRWNGIICEYFCKETQTYLPDHRQCRNSCKVQNTSCVQCDSLEVLKCKQCDQNTFLFEGKCILQCPENSFVNQMRECILCSNQCKTCNSADECTTCNLPDISSPPPQCSCPDSKVYYNQQCILSCPIYYDNIQDKGICVRQCPKQKYPVVDSVTSQISCIAVSDSVNDFCLAHLNKVDKLIKVQLQTKNNDNNYYYLVVQVDHTPYVCYSYYARSFQGQGGVLINQYFEENIDSFKIYFQFYKDYLVNCVDGQCEIKLEIQWMNRVQYSFSIKYKLQTQGTLETNIQIDGTQKESEIACQDCYIPNEKVISSLIEIVCSQDQTCESDKITAPASSVITLIQKVNDPQYSSLTVLPHSLKLQQDSIYKGVNIPFTYVNSIPGQISYSFIAQSIPNSYYQNYARIYITSVTKRSNTGRLLADSQSSQVSVNYPRQQFDIRITEKPNGNSQNSQNGEQLGDDSSTTSALTIVIIVVVVVLCASIAIAIAFYCLYRRMKSKENRVIPITTNPATLVEGQEIAKKSQNQETLGNINTNFNPEQNQLNV